MRKLNDETPFIRQCINLWFASNRHVKEFCVTEVIEDILSVHAVLRADEALLRGAVKDDMKRRAHIGLLSYRTTDKHDNPNKGRGRPPRIYTKVFCKNFK